eukprot:CAMPEP_0117444100 /NCGR_PEP_ID=MMETSP0759-20121206/5055_1 /TAXON_ID=63605 /ORGANISM="Percolomonas cosmopolitus, Strain WS" /LENGTH=103 /DNA_ID=CAMNT_0005236133 /DNA_START=133 /DNA_END=444 /DNA_ORIENTATION=+
MADIESTLERIKKHQDVLGYLILSHDNRIIREFSALPDSENQHSVYAKEITELTAKARSVVRDLNPQNDLTFLRMRTKTSEVLIAPEKEYVLIVIQAITKDGV